MASQTKNTRMSQKRVSVALEYLKVMLIIIIVSADHMMDKEKKKVCSTPHNYYVCY